MMGETKDIEITFNGVKEKIPEGMTIAELINFVNEKDNGLIVEVNNKYVFPQDYEKIVIKPGDKVEFINPDFGG